MEQKDATESAVNDREQDPKVIALRNALFKQYVEPYYNMIYKLCIQYTFNKRYIEENYTEVLANLYRGVESYDPSRDILVWLHICTKRCVFKMERQRMAYDGMKDEGVFKNYVANASSTLYMWDEDDDSLGVERRCSPIDNIPCTLTSENVSVENWENLFDDDITNALSLLPKTHRDAFLLQIAGYSLKEIADIEYNKGTIPTRNIETVKRRTFNARNSCVPN